jgi:hypothetical protein
VDATIKMLEAYCNWLENRVVSWFDRAAAERNLAVMAEVVRIMAGEAAGRGRAECGLGAGWLALAGWLGQGGLA